MDVLFALIVSGLVTKHYIITNHHCIRKLWGVCKKCLDFDDILYYDIIIISAWFHTTPLGKSEWSLGCGGTIN